MLGRGFNFGESGGGVEKDGIWHGSIHLINTGTTVFCASVWVGHASRQQERNVSYSNEGTVPGPV